MLVAVLVMYASSLAYLLLDFISFLNTAKNPVSHYETSPSVFKRQSIGITLCLGLNVRFPTPCASASLDHRLQFLLSDAIVLWRAVIFWSGNKPITYISVAMIFASFGVCALSRMRVYV